MKKKAEKLDISHFEIPNMVFEILQQLKKTNATLEKMLADADRCAQR
jgi:hypothetical protein